MRTAVDPGSRPGHGRHRCSWRARQRPQSGAPCGRVGLSPLLGGRASQHAGHCERGDIHRHRAYCGRHAEHPGGCGRHHAAEPFAVGDRGAVRHARAPVPRPHRPGAWPGAGNRPAHAFARCAALPQRQSISRRTCWNCRRILPRPNRASASRRYRRRERKCRSGSWGRAFTVPLSRRNSACPMRLPRISRPTQLMPASAVVSQPLQAFPTARPPLCDGRRQHHRRRQRRRGAPVGHDAANVFRQPASRSGGLSRPPIDDIESYWTPAEKAQAMHMLARSIIGSPNTVRAGIDALVAETGADELMIVSDVYDHAARLRSFELIAAS